jgi:hypothetical protein
VRGCKGAREGREGEGRMCGGRRRERGGTGGREVSAVVRVATRDGEGREAEALVDKGWGGLVVTKMWGTGAGVGWGVVDR